jgi:hypothetical protein
MGGSHRDGERKLRCRAARRSDETNPPHGPDSGLAVEHAGGGRRRDRAAAGGPRIFPVP